MIGIIDYDMGNVGSIKKMLQKIGVEAVITRDPELLKSADKLILPGVGAFAKGMQNLAQLNLINILNELVLEKKTPVLGICLGMQLLTTHSEEGNVNGFNWIKAHTIRFPEKGIRIPHMGWNNIKVSNDNILFNGLETDNRFYFVHSYYVQPENILHEASSTEYILPFSSAIYKNNIYGVQFHPEKSHRFGLKLLKNFVSLNTL
ncbi:MAG: imidazole glycerol phosphate synthase subunit HisH [Chitinophagaceae bacterium]